MNIISALLIGACLFSCTKAEDPKTDPTPEPDGVAMTATVKSVGDRIEVDVVESEYTSGVHWVITSESTLYLDKSGAAISRSDIRAGDTVKIIYSGQVMMSLPPQIVALSIKKL